MNNLRIFLAGSATAANFLYFFEGKSTHQMVSLGVMIIIVYFWKEST